MLRADDHRRRRASAAGRKSGRSVWRCDSAWLIGGLVGALLLCASLWGLRLQQDNAAAAQHGALRQAVGMAASLLQADLAQALATVDTLELLVRSTGQVESFDRLAQDLMLRNPLISAIALAPGGVIRQVAPMEGQAALIGRRMHDDPVAHAELVEAVRKRAPVVSQPQPLMGGGVGTVVRLPVFRSAADTDAVPALWGFVLVQVRLPDVPARLAAAGLPDADARYLLSTMDGNTGHRVTFFPFPAPTLEAVETASINLPQRQWTLTVEALPRAGTDGLAAKVAAGLVSAAVGLGCALLLRRRRMRLARRNFYRQSVPPLLWDDDLDDTHRALERVRHRPGWAVMLVVRLPDGPRPVDAAGPGAPVQAMLRDDDLLVPLGGPAFLVVAHSLADRAVAERVGRRLAAQARSLGPDGRVQVQQRLFSQPQADIRVLFAETVADMHIDHAAQRKRTAPERGDIGLVPRFAETLT
jgi:sensor domain CHASE-containing protein